MARIVFALIFAYNVSYIASDILSSVPNHAAVLPSLRLELEQKRPKPIAPASSVFAQPGKALFYICECDTCKMQVSKGGILKHFCPACHSSRLAFRKPFIGSVVARSAPTARHRRTLDVEFAAIHDAAGIDLACPATGKRKGDKYAEGDKHECTAACHRYGFHDERRAFVTLNAPNMTREALQSLMRHANPETTTRYINMAKQLNPAVQSLQVPAFLTNGKRG